MDAAVDAESPHEIVPVLSQAVAAIHPGLDWELGDGTEARHALVVSAAGDPDLRAIARRWRRSAPLPDEIWEYADTRQPVRDIAGVSLEVDGVHFGFDSATVAATVDADRGCVDVVVHHPEFATASQTVAEQVTFLMLDGALGEEAVETWIGDISPTGVPSSDAIPLGDLAAVIDDLRDKLTGDDGDGTWVILQGETRRGEPVLASASLPLRPMIAPHLDTHVGVTLQYSKRAPNGWPAASSLDQLRAMEDHIDGRLGGSGRIVAHESASGARTLHFYVDGLTPAAEQIRAAVVGWAEGGVKVTVDADPGWDRVAHLKP